MASPSILQSFCARVKRALRPPVGPLSWRSARAAPAALLAVTLGSVPSTAPFVATTGVALIAGVAPASAQVVETPILCHFIRPLANGDRECLVVAVDLLGIVLDRILGPNDPVAGDPSVCVSTTGITPTNIFECQDFGLDLFIDLDLPPPEDAIVWDGCGLFLDIFTTKCRQGDDPELSSDPDYVSPLFVPELTGGIENTLFDLEDAAVQDVLDVHQLPAADVDRVLDFARNDVRAMIFARLAGIAEMDPLDRTVEEQELVDAFAAAIRDRRILAAQLAQDEYLEWASRPCFYSPPGDFTYDPGLTCLGGLPALFTTTPPPSSEEFQAYGAARAYDVMTHPKKGLLVAADTSNALSGKLTAAFSAGVQASLVTFIAIALALTNIFPNSIGFVTAVAGATSVAVGALVSAAAIVFVAVVIGVIQIINVGEWDAIPGELAAAVAEAEQQPPNLTQLVQTGDEKGLQEFYAAFIAATLPDRPGEGPAPAATANDDRFRITDEQGDNAVVSPEIDFLSWDAPDPWSARLSDGWFVVNGIVETDEGDLPFETLSLKIPYEGWDGENWTAWRIGTSFLHLRDGPDSDPEDPADSFQSDEIEFVDANGVNRIATIDSDGTPPEITPQVAGTLGDNGWYVSDVDLSWSIVEEESDIESQSSGCNTEQITTDFTAFMRTCTASSLGGEASASVTIKRDATAPEIGVALIPTPNAAGWNNSAVTAEFGCDDSTSGIASCAEDISFDSDGSGQEATGVARDNAGNESSINFLVKIDTIPPTISGAASPSANAAGWNNSDVTVEFTCADSLLGSGISSCTADQTLSAEGSGQQASGTAVDKADNTSSTTVPGIAIDITPPLVTLVTPPEGATYVQNQVVLAQWTATDALSGIASESGSAPNGQPIDTSGAGDRSSTVEASDAAGNTSAATHGYSVLSAAQAAATLVSQADAAVSHKGTENSLISKLDNAKRSLDRGQLSAARGKLGAFINQVRAQRGKKIAAADADALIAYAQLILAATSSPSS